MEKPLNIRPDGSEYISPYDDLSSEGASSDYLLGKAGPLLQRRHQSWRKGPSALFVQAFIHILLIIANVTLCIFYLNYASNSCSHGPDIIYTPARSSMNYEERIFDLDDIYLGDYMTVNPNKPMKFNGPPSQELENAWENLTKYQNLRLTKEELGEHGDERSLVELPDGGYFGTLTVYHSLHCVRRLHHWMYLDHYYPNISGVDYLRLRGHTEHCLDTLRQNIQCGADTSIQAFHWGTTQRVPMSHDDSTHECVNWDKLDAWSAKHNFNPFKPGYLRHPNLGLAYPNGIGDPLGLVNDHRLNSM